MHLLTASRNSIHQLKKLLHSLFLASPNTTTSLLKLLLMLELLASSFSVFKSQSLLLRESLPLPLERLPSTLKNSLRLLLIKELSHILLLLFLIQMLN